MRLSRRKIAEFLVTEIEAGRDDVIAKTAAYLVSESRTKELPLLVRDIQKISADHGVVVAEIVSARHLSDKIVDSLLTELAKIIGVESVTANLSVDESVLGGVLVQIPGAELDATVAGKIRKLRAAKV
ncbi:F0F1 ATP synthase subunit delta [Candidatus Saccharibacteria bacterium]|nr:F0F1 ATP synthase subunit delta [Candidatus Saccharibacteria bacterium]